MKNSVVIPMFNEGQNPLFPQILKNLKSQELRCIFVDGGSSDATVSQVQNAGFPVIVLPHTNRAQRINAGIQNTEGIFVLLHHPRTLLATAALSRFANLSTLSWGGFTHSFDVDHPILRFTSFYSNYVRVRRGIIYLDHCIFAPRAWLEQIGGVPELEIFEDTELCLRLRKIAPPVLLPEVGKTSAIRFTKNGILKQSLLNQYMKIAYYLRQSPEKMNRHYEKNLGLNQEENGKI